MSVSEKIKNYNADEVVISLGPVLIQGGVADGEFLRIEQDSNDTEDVVGSMGEVSVSRTNDRRATATLVLMSTADANDGLSTLSNLVKTATGMAGAIHPLIVKDLNGRLLVEGANCWVSKPPDISLDRTATPREWSIRISHLARFDGGN